LQDAQARLTQQATHDALTGLPNRALLMDRIEQALVKATRSRRCTAVFFVDIDHFKQINDNFGHAAGDQLLVEVARRLKASVRITDQVSRLGGDEFTVVLEDSGDADDRLMQCERLLTSLSRPHVLSGQSIAATPSLGVAVYLPGEPLEELRSRADAAMYEAKRAGKACLRWAPPRVRETRRPE
jgi:diguanylate cyclase (GGDEF)-like protein